MKANKEKRNIKKNMEMNRKNSVVTYALVGLAAGTIAWLLLGTKEGRRQVGRASEGIKDFSRTVQKKTKEGMHEASKLAGRAANEFEDFRDRAKSKGQSVVNKAERLAKDGVDKASNAAKSVKRDIEEEF